MTRLFSLRYRLLPVCQVPINLFSLMSLPSSHVDYGVTCISRDSIPFSLILSLIPGGHILLCSENGEIFQKLAEKSLWLTVQHFAPNISHFPTKPLRLPIDLRESMSLMSWNRDLCLLCQCRNQEGLKILFLIWLTVISLPPGYLGFRCSSNSATCMRTFRISLGIGLHTHTHTYESTWPLRHIHIRVAAFLGHTMPHTIAQAIGHSVQGSLRDMGKLVSYISLRV